MPTHPAPKTPIAPAAPQRERGALGGPKSPPWKASSGGKGAVRVGLLGLFLKGVVRDRRY